MKKYPLVGLKQKIVCVLIILFLLVMNYLINIAFPFPKLIKYTFLIFSIILSIAYAYVIFSSVVIIDIKNHLVNVKILKSRTINLEKVNRIVCENHKVQQKTVKVIVFYHDNHYVGEIDTFFNPKQDLLANNIIDACKDASI